MDFEAGTESMIKFGIHAYRLDERDLLPFSTGARSGTFHSLKLLSLRKLLELDLGC